MCPCCCGIRPANVPTWSLSNIDEAAAGEWGYDKDGNGIVEEKILSGS
jgi:hypothetical protein